MPNNASHTLSEGVSKTVRCCWCRRCHHHYYYWHIKPWLQLRFDYDMTTIWLGCIAVIAYITIVIWLRYDDATTHSTTTEVIEITIRVQFECDTTRTQQRQKIDVFIVCSRRIMSNGSRHEVIEITICIQFDCDTTTIRLWHIARACFHSTRAKNEHVNFSSQLCHNCITVESQL